MFDKEGMDVNKHIEKRCKIGQGAACCKYPIMSAQGWICAKLDPSLKAKIDGVAFRMRAKGDNCDGRDLSTATKGVLLINTMIIEEGTKH